MTLFDVLGGIGIVVGLEAMIALFLLIKYLVCITSPCGWGQEDFIEEDKCVCEHPDSECCRVDMPKVSAQYFGGAMKAKSLGKKKKVK